jgi:hypothetical protein
MQLPLTYQLNLVSTSTLAITLLVFLFAESRGKQYALAFNFIIIK